MAKSDNSRNLLKLIDRLSATDAIDVLRLLARDKNLAARIRPIMEKYLTQKAPQSLEEVHELAAEVLEDLEDLEVEEVWDRAGPKRHGYVEPVEVAGAMMQECIGPYLAEMARYQSLKRPVEASYVCMGVLKGLYQFAQASDSEFKDWAPDSAFSYAYDILDRWRKGGTKQETVKALRAFIEADLPVWKDSLLRLVRLRKAE